ncbi:MAG: ASKHA domain-containing protein [Candidatus Helarchaeota archaeon]
MTKCIITFQPEGKRVEAQINSTVLEIIKACGIDLVSICNGNGKCGKCRILINDPTAVNKITLKEKDLLNEDEIKSGYRLACLTRIKSDLIVNIPEESRTGKQKLQVEGIQVQVKINPSVNKFYLELKPPTLDNLSSDYEILENELKNHVDFNKISININLLKNLAKIIRESNWKITITLWDNEIIAIEQNNTSDRIFGYAVDIGTTKLAGYLINLKTGTVMAVGSLMNPQIPFGEDVISRLNYLDAKKLQELICEGINKVLNNLKEKTGIVSSEIYEITVVGNTVMHHLFHGIAAKYLGIAPYSPVIRDSLILEVRNNNLDINPNGKLYSLPLIGGFIGSDTTAVILATRIHKKKDICLAIDIGTNTEVIIGNKDKLFACSCASGPAFEGAHVKFGMRASSGAIEKIEIEPNMLEPKFQTIDNIAPNGICGSGMIDLVAEMLKVGIINIDGIFNKNVENWRIIQDKDGYEYIIVSNDNENKKQITFSQKDVNQILLAKAAIHTGIKILMKQYGISKEDIQQFYIAGAFGSHINKESARIIGLFPEINLNKIKFVGNAAGTGARMCLLSKKMKKEAEIIAKSVKYIELGNDPNFQKEFLSSLFIPHANLSDFPKTSELLKRHGNFPEKLPPLFFDKNP